MHLAHDLARRYAYLSSVEAVALGGSVATGQATEASDIDLYVYISAPITPDERARIVSDTTDPASIRNDYWGPGDEWRDAASGIHVDVMFWHTGWIEEQLNRVLQRHEASVGYSTSFLYTVLHSRLLFDRGDWFHRLQEHARQPYPEALAEAIIANNHPILRRTESSYRHQLEKAMARRDLVSINHRVAALLVSYFDILFALNRLPHPGEKRLLEYAEQHCLKRPDHMRANIEALIRASSDDRLLAQVDRLIDGLEALL